MLGNNGDERALPPLQLAAEDAEPLVCEAAKWAIEQIEHRKEVGVRQRIWDSCPHEG